MKSKVILLHNHDNAWTPEDLVEVAEDNRLVLAALRAHGYEVVEAKVYDSVAQALRDKHCDLREWTVFNWCEGYADRPWDYAGVVDELEHLQYVYTGATPWTLRVTQDKRTTRALLHDAGVPLRRSRTAGRGHNHRPWPVRCKFLFHSAKDNEVNERGCAG